MHISRRPLPEREQFLNRWIALLRQRKGQDADAWLREAIRMAEGTHGLGELAQAEGKKRPRAFLDWIVALEQEKKTREVVTAAQQALSTLPQLPIRAAIADHFCAAARVLGDAEAARAGRWEAFAAKPTLARLLDLWAETPQAQRKTQMRRAAARVKAYLAHLPKLEAFDFVNESELGEMDDAEEPAWPDRSLLAHAYLLGQEWAQAHQLADRQKVLGWSDGHNPQGLVLSCFLVMLSGQRGNTVPHDLAALWKQAQVYSTDIGFAAANDGSALLKRVQQVYAEVLADASLSPRQQKQFLTWCISVARRRVNAIVGGQHRNSYGKAATLILASAEVLRRRGKRQEADTLVDGVRSRFPNHRAFLPLLDNAAGRMKRKLR